MKRSILLIIFSATLVFTTKAQDSTSAKKSPFSINSDFYSSFMFRGVELSGKPNIQPYVTFNKGGFTCGGWGSISLNGDYSELDIFASYKLKNFVFTATDYYVMSIDPGANYFDFSEDKTGHCIEGSLAFTGTEKFPLSLMAASFVYGADKDTSDVNYYSTYAEACYSFRNADIFIGITPAEGFYGKDFGVVNAGIKVKRKVKISDNITIPACVTVGANPMGEKVYIVAGFTL